MRDRSGMRRSPHGPASGSGPPAIAPPRYHERRRKRRFAEPVPQVEPPTIAKPARSSRAKCPVDARGAPARRSRRYPTSDSRRGQLTAEQLTVQTALRAAELKYRRASRTSRRWPPELTVETGCGDRRVADGDPGRAPAAKKGAGRDRLTTLHDPDLKAQGPPYAPEVRRRPARGRRQRVEQPRRVHPFIAACDRRAIGKIHRPGST
jgi:hypothetical protein